MTDELTLELIRTSIFQHMHYMCWKVKGELEKTDVEIVQTILNMGVDAIPCPCFRIKDGEWNGEFDFLNMLLELTTHDKEAEKWEFREEILDDECAEKIIDELVEERVKILIDKEARKDFADLKPKFNMDHIDA